MYVLCRFDQSSVEREHKLLRTEQDSQHPVQILTRNPFLSFYLSYLFIFPLKWLRSLLFVFCTVLILAVLLTILEYRWRERNMLTDCERTVGDIEDLLLSAMFSMEFKFKKKSVGVKCASQMVLTFLLEKFLISTVKSLPVKYYYYLSFSQCFHGSPSSIRQPGTACNLLTKARTHERLPAYL